MPFEVAERFVAAETHEERLKWVRFPERVDAEMKEFFTTGPGAVEKVKYLWALPSVTSGDLLFQEFRAELEGGASRLISVSVDPEGAKVDFGCYAMRGSATWNDLVAGEVGTAENMKVLLQAGSFYLHEFSDEQQWIHFTATTPDFPDPLDFYLKREDPAVTELSNQGSTAFRAIVSLRAVDGSAKHRQFEITSVQALGWAAIE